MMDESMVGESVVSESMVVSISVLICFCFCFVLFFCFGGCDLMVDSAAVVG